MGEFLVLQVCQGCGREVFPSSEDLALLVWFWFVGSGRFLRSGDGCWRLADVVILWSVALTVSELTAKRTRGWRGVMRVTFMQEWMIKA